MTPETRISLEKHRKEYDIHFIKDVAAEEWPPKHIHVLEAIRKLSTIKYDEYGSSTSNVSQDHLSFNLFAKRLAKTLVKRAESCRRRNEASWRFACEPLVFTRMSAEVACPNCLQRTWLSEITVSPSLVNSGRGAESLRQRQQLRKPCVCLRASRPGDHQEVVELNKIFIDRAQEAVIHQAELASKLPKGEHPDLVYGLRQTRNLENMLYTPIGNGKLVRDLLQRSPMSEDGVPLLFPFLILEAKSGKSDYDWHSIKLQTCFPIYTFLQAQRNLKVVAANRSKWQDGPLVWFFLNKGEDWRLCLGYQKDSINGGTQTDIQEVWKGSIDVLDDALQLFLIVDYMCEWARDVYRPAILKELQVISTPDDLEVQTIVTDPDIYSTAHTTVSDSQPEEPEQTQIGRSQVAKDIISQFRTLDSYGSVRHAVPIESKYSCLFITRDNIETMLQSIPENLVHQFLRLILSELRTKNIMVQSEFIHAIEKEWTGHNRITLPSTSGSRFYAVITALFYLTPLWDQVRELSVIAVEASAFDIVIARSGLKAGRGKACPLWQGYPYGQTLVEYVRRLKHRSIRSNLLSTIQRDARYIFSAGSEILSSNPNPNPPPIFQDEDDGTSWELVNKMYKLCKTGRLEPELPFLKVSSRTEAQSRAYEDDADPIDLSRDDWPDPLQVEVWPEPLQVSQHQAVLLHGEAHFHETGNTSSICMFLLHDPRELPDLATIAKALKETYEDFDVYHTTRNNGRHRLIKPKADKVPWNITNTYGVFFPNYGPGFKQWLRHLEWPLPCRQGSPRGEHLCGTVFKRTQRRPWKDLRLDRQHRKEMYDARRLKYVSDLVRSELIVWLSISRERRERGESCCLACASFYDERSGACKKCRGFCNTCRPLLGCRAPPVILDLWLDALRILDAATVDESHNIRLFMPQFKNRARTPSNESDLGSLNEAWNSDFDSTALLSELAYDSEYELPRLPQKLAVRSGAPSSQRQAGSTSERISPGPRKRRSSDSDYTPTGKSQKRRSKGASGN